jgi:UDPglucose 6-dehydrogenase
MKVTVIGTGYVGLVTGSIFSIQGHEVTCVDIDQKKVDGLRRGILPIYEPGLEEVVELGVSQGCLQFTTDTASAAADSDVIFLAVGTPQSESGAANLAYLKTAAESIACSAKKGAIVVIKSTVPVGTNRRIAELIQAKCGHSVDVANNPEFLKEGTAVDDCLSPDRIVLGVRNKRVADVMQRLYAPLLATVEHCKVLLMEPESAEMTKYTANCFLAMKISFINEMANLCEQLGADIEEVRQGICSDHRIGWEFLKPGAGYGGSCFPKDVRALINQAEVVGADASMLQTVDEVNERQKAVIPRKVQEHFDGDVQGKKFAVWGLAFKPGTDDIREAPAIRLIESLLEAGAEVSVHDPEAMKNIEAVFGDRISYHDEKFDALRSTDALVVMTDWAEYIGIDPSIVRWHSNGAVVFDGRNCLRREWFSLANFDYYTIGQSPLKRSHAWPENRKEASHKNKHQVVPVQSTPPQSKEAYSTLVFV